MIFFTTGNFWFTVPENLRVKYKNWWRSLWSIHDDDECSCSVERAIDTSILRWKDKGGAKAMKMVRIERLSTCTGFRWAKVAIVSVLIAPVIDQRAENPFVFASSQNFLAKFLITESIVCRRIIHSSHTASPSVCLSVCLSSSSRRTAVTTTTTTLTYHRE
jgi:hypothetical protein